MNEFTILVRKRERRLELYDSNTLIKSYAIVLGFSPDGDKEIEGDGKTPEGEFYVFGKNPESKFHLSIGLSYPSKEDAERGLRDGIIDRKEHDSIITAINNGEMPPQKTGLGGEIYIHGGGVESDWTCGCVAMTNEDIEELYDILLIGTPVLIRP